MTYKLLFLDVDGTILPPDHQYTFLTKEAIEKAQKNGIEVFIATGRPIHEIKFLTDELNIQSCIGYNGASAVYRNETVMKRTMARETVLEVIDLAKKHKHEIAFFTREKNYFTTFDDALIQQFIETFTFKNNARYESSIVDEVLSMSIAHVKPEELSIYEHLDIQLTVINVPGFEKMYDVVQKNITKGTAIEFLLDRLNVDKSEAIAFGDGENDIEMLQSVGIGFAMGNAHPELLKRAKYITKTASESGIYYGLKEIKAI